jgi:hypothetical protein
MAEMERSSPLIVHRLPSGPTTMSLERAGDGGTAIELGDVARGSGCRAGLEGQARRD